MVGSADVSISLPYKTLFPPGIQLYNPPSFLVEQARFARIKVACVADYQIREIPITGTGSPKIFWQDELIKMYFLAIFEQTFFSFQQKSYV